MLKSKIKSITAMLTITIGLTASGMMLQPSVTAFAGDATGTTASFSDILSNQLPEGGWKKTYTETNGDWAKSTIDNKATYSEIRRLASEYLKTNDSKYSEAAIKGINFLLKMQYDNGGWPQVYEGSSYHINITYNDDAMINVMLLLDEIANKKGDFSFVDNTLADSCKAAVDKGVGCLLKTQVIANGKLTVWGQQHDPIALKPAAARAYEAPSLCAKESVNIVKFLKTRPATTEITSSIKAAEEWFNTVKFTGIKTVKTSTDVTVENDASVTTPLWARFYELGTNRPIFIGRDTIVKYNLSEIEQERRTGYSWYGNWASDLVK
jgi:PelA/Pel-15E family pectate lyase